MKILSSLLALFSAGSQAITQAAPLYLSLVEVVPAVVHAAEEKAAQLAQDAGLEPGAKLGALKLEYALQTLEGAATALGASATLFSNIRATLAAQVSAYVSLWKGINALAPTAAPTPPAKQ
jgi:hypothetical protein